LVTPILEKGQRKRDVYLPEIMPLSNIPNKDTNIVPSHIEPNGMLSSDTKPSTSSNTLNEKFIWKQMGTAKGKGRLYKGGRWLKDKDAIEVNNYLYSVVL
jgi:hypothetical protein